MNEDVVQVKIEEDPYRSLIGIAVRITPEPIIISTNMSVLDIEDHNLSDDIAKKVISAIGDAIQEDLKCTLRDKLHKYVRGEVEE